MQARYEGHLIQVYAVQVPHSGLWRCVAVIHWSERNEGHLKTLSCEDREFANEDDALRIALEVAQKWIRDGKPEPFTWTTDLR